MDPDDRTNVRRIVICLLRLDLWVVETIMDGLNVEQRLENIEHHFRHMWENPPLPRVIDGWLQSPELYHSQPLPALRKHIESMTARQLYAVVMNPSAGTFYTRLVLKLFSKVLEQKKVNSYAAEHLDRAFEENQGLLLIQRPANRGEYLIRLVHIHKESQLRLKAVIREARVFRDSIGEAVQTKSLNDSAQELLRGKLEALNEYYDEACRELRGEEVPEMLMDVRRKDFWNLSPQTPPDTPPSHAVDAYPEMAQLNFLPVLIIVILGLYFLALVLASLSFFSTPLGHGSSTDANYYQLLSGNVLQILSVVTLLWPTVFHTRLSLMAWLWTWALAGIAMICAVSSMILYLRISVGWSCFIGFLGQASLGVVSLMLISRV